MCEGGRCKHVGQEIRAVVAEESELCGCGCGAREREEREQVGACELDGAGDFGHEPSNAGGVTECGAVIACN